MPSSNKPATVSVGCTAKIDDRVVVGNTSRTVGVAVPFDKYLLLGRVNVGGMAEVFLAKTFGAEGFERFVAIKRLLPQVMDNKEFIDMFIDEAKIAVQLTHSNIAQIYELGKHAQQLFIAMEFVHGKELRALANRAKKIGQRLEPDICAYMIAKAAEGLDYAHQRKDPNGKPIGIVHRDISPQNILVSFDGDVKIIDFGIAKAKDRISQTQVGILKGKIGYMSPEQVTGLAIDQRSDLFALGCVLYELVTGERAFKGQSDFSTFEKVRNAEYVPPEFHGISVDPNLDKIMRKALAKDREQRYSRGNEMAADLQRFLLRREATINNDTIAEVMHELFASELAAENQKLAEYRQMKPPPGLVGKDEEDLEEAEALLDDHTHVVMLDDKTKTDKVAFARVGDDEDDPPTLSEPVAIPAQPAKPPAQETRVVAPRTPPPRAPPERPAERLPEARATDSRATDSRGTGQQRRASEGTGRKPPPLSGSQELVADIREALKQMPPADATHVLPLTKKKQLTNPRMIAPRTIAPSAAAHTRDPEWTQSPMPTQMSRTLTDLEVDDGFTIGELLLIVGAGVIAVLFVIGVYFYTMHH